MKYRKKPVVVEEEEELLGTIIVTLYRKEKGGYHVDISSNANVMEVTKWFNRLIEMVLEMSEPAKIQGEECHGQSRKAQGN